MPIDDQADDGYAGLSYEPPAIDTPLFPSAEAARAEAPADVTVVADVVAADVAPAVEKPIGLFASIAASAATAVLDDPPAAVDLDDITDADDEEESSSTARDLLEWAAVLVAAVALALVFKAFLFQAFWIPTESMESTLEKQDRVLVNKVSYRLHDINRGDVVVFRRPDPDPADDIKDLIKRVIATSGETIEGKDGVIYIDGERLIEPYLDAGVASTSFDFGPLVVDAEHIFVMGDNRDRSYDSRYFGTVPESDVKGRAFVLFWPLDRLGGL